MEEMCSSEMSFDSQRTKRRYVLEDRTLEKLLFLSLFNDAFSAATGKILWMAYLEDCWKWKNSAQFKFEDCLP
jgi:hypothetical protein